MQHIHRIVILAGSLVAALLPTVCSAQQPCLQQAWSSYNAKDYAKAIEAADECIDSFAVKAAKEEEVLRSRRVPAPVTGNATAQEKHDIFARGVLNDIGAAYFVKGRSAEFLAKKKPQYKPAAKAAYAKCVTLSYARTWDNQGWFWSTAEACQERLDGLQ